QVGRARPLADRADGDAGVERGRVELRAPERTRAIMRTFYVIEIESSAERDWMVANGATVSGRDTRPGPPPLITHGAADRLEIAGSVSDDMADDWNAGLPRKGPIVRVWGSVEL